VSGNELNLFGGITRDRLEEILTAIGSIRVALVGDICLDAYWKADMTLSELSRETPNFRFPLWRSGIRPGRAVTLTSTSRRSRPHPLPPWCCRPGLARGRADEGTGGPWR